MTTSPVADALARLRAAADKVRAGWLPESWEKVSGEGPATYGFKPISVFGPAGTFDPMLALPRGGSVTVRAPLRLPEQIEGVPSAKDPLELTVFSLFPMRIRHRNAGGEARELWSDPLGPAAAGPVAIRVLEEITGGDDGWIELEVSAFDNHVYAGWNWLHFGTPGTRARFELLDLAWARLFVADALAVSPAEVKAVETAALAVPESLAVADGAGLEAALGEVAVALAPLREAAAALRVHVIGHSHIDLAWLWTWRDTVEIVKRDFRSVLSMMEDYPELTFTHSQPASYEVVRREEPRLFEAIKARVAEGRWEPATMQWVEGDENLAGSESAARQMLEAVSWTREHLGVSPSTFIAPDTFGHAGQVPQIAAAAGAKVYYHHRCNPGRPAQWPAYWWEGQDGTRLLAVSTPSYNGLVTAGALAQAAVSAHRAGLGVALYFQGVGDHGGGPTRAGLDTLRRLQGQAGLPDAACSTIGAYARDVISSGARLPVHRGESRTTFEGCYTTHADTKAYNRHGENLLLSAETLSVLAGVDRRDALTEAWRRVLFNQFHDILDGSAIPEVYRDQAADFAAVEATAREVTEASLELLASRGASGADFTVTNPLGFARTDLVFVPGISRHGPVVVEDENGRRSVAQPAGPQGLVFVAEVPAFATLGYRVLAEDAAGGGGPTVDLQGAAYVVETPHFRAAVSTECGAITALYDKRVGRQVVGLATPWPVGESEFHHPELGLNVLTLRDERPHGMSAWIIGPVEREQALISGGTVEVVEQGPVRAVLAITQRVRSSAITQRISFYRDLPRIDVAMEIDWQEPGNDEVGTPGLVVAFNTSLAGAQAWYETPFGAVSRPADAREVPALRWGAIGTGVAGSGYGLAVVNESKHGYEALGSRLRMSLVRTAYDPDPASDIGRHELAYSIVPHPGDWRFAGVPRTAAGFNQPLLARAGRVGSEPVREADAPAWRPVLDADPAVTVSALKPARHGRGALLRLFEGHGVPASAALRDIPEGAEVWEVSPVEDRLARLRADGGRIELSFAPWQVRSILVEV